MGREAFVAALSGVWEHSPWIAARAWERRPFASIQELLGAMWRAVIEASAEERLALIQAHPDLAGRLARAGRLTAESTDEQASAGLDRLTDAERAAFETRNAAYRERFGFPFIICAREHTKASILAAFDRRLGHSRADEIQTALDEIRKIAWLRLVDVLGSPVA